MATEAELHAPAASDPYAAFRSRGFRLFAMGGLLQVIGRQMLSVGVGWEVYRRTGSALALGLVGLVSALPVIALAIPAGIVADRFSRKNDSLAHATRLRRRLGGPGGGFLYRGGCALDIRPPSRAQASRGPSAGRRAGLSW